MKNLRGRDREREGCFLFSNEQNREDCRVEQETGQQRRESESNTRERPPLPCSSLYLLTASFGRIQTMAIATLALCYNNHKVFRGVVKIRKGLAVSLMLEGTSMASLYTIFERFSLQLRKQIPPSDPNAAKTHAALDVSWISLLVFFLASTKKKRRRQE